jgi:two-component system chemotaxis response regulator CheY
MPHSPTILIVEDDRDIRESLQQILEFENYQVSSAQNGQEALKSLSQLPLPCLIVLDLFMPIMNGSQFLEALREKGDANLTHIPTLVLSASPAEGEIAKAVRPYIAEFIKKPVDLDKFIESIQKHCCSKHERLGTEQV